ncbi:MAG: ATP-binding protein [Selenomonadaceae bacterium]|nr:ATP-binding protein [Selenomonadaceae bacterium]MBR1860126.1 ATP-binding protein [Selenomonadaceae bacterium]
MLKDVAFPAKRELLPQMLNKINDEIKAHVDDDKLINRLKVCAEEILVNIVDYAYSDKTADNKLFISCEYLEDKDALRFEFVDAGTPYNPLEQAPEVDLDADIDERGIGGLGIFLYTTIMDKTEYFFKDGKNHLITLKYLTDRKGE